MKANEEIIPAFLTGGGQMGELIRCFDWSKTALGRSDTWPQSLRIAVRIMLDCPFGMYIAWGEEYIQLYNDGYRPILGATKHPQALGISTRKTFAEIWPTIGPMFEGVMQGTPVGFPDFTLQLDRNGFLEECVFDFAYSPIRLENAEVGGVLVTVIETTEKVKATKALKESQQQLQFAIDATDLGTWDLNPATNKFRSNSRLKEWFGLTPEEEIELPFALAVIAQKDRDRVTAAIQKSLQVASGGQYDIIYTIIHPHTKNERIVRAKGLASFNDEAIAYLFTGTLQDVTKEIVASGLLGESEAKFRTLSENIPHMVWTATPDGKKNFFNQYFLDYTGLSFEELKGHGWQAIIFPDDLKKELQEWNHTLKTGEDLKIEKRIRRHDGTYRWHRCHSIAQKDQQGNITGWIGTNTDIEEEKKITEALAKAEEQFRTFANNIQNLAWIANGDGSVYWYNQRWYDYTGTTLEEMESWGWQKVHHPDHVEKITTLIKELWKKDEAFELTFPLRRHDGEYHWFLTSAYPVKDSKGNIERWIGTNTDVTQQKAFTEELESKVKKRTAELEERKIFVETILNTSKEYIAVYATDFTLIDFNKAVEIMMGKKREELIGKKLLELMPNARGTKAETDLQSAFNGNSIHNEPYQSPVTGRYIENYIFPLKDNQGNVYAALTIASDVTNIALKQKEIETVNVQLELQNQTFELAESIARFGSYKWNMTTGSLEYSDNLFRLLDCEPQEFIPSFEKFLSFIHPDDLNQVIKNGEETMITGALIETPYRIISKTGAVKYLRSSGNFSGEGANRILIGTVQDISKDILAAEALVEKENYLNQVITNAPDAVIVIDDKSIIRLWNPKTEEIFGWKAAEVLGSDLTDIIIPGHYRDAHQEGMKRLLKTGEIRILNKALELTALNKEGKEFPISITISQATQQGNKLFIAFLRDITVEKRTIELAINNQSLLLANHELEAAQKLSEKLLTQKDEFISIASHEMKTPLTTAKGYIELLLLSLSEENQTALYAKKANQAVERLHDLVTELLDASKIQNGQLNYNITKFDFNKMLDETIENIQHSAKNHIIQKTGFIQHEFTGDSGRLQQVLINLLSNAIKYSPKAEKVLIKLEEKDQKIRVSVQDFGIGIQKQHLDKIFDRYYRVQEQATHFQGLGIGLYISHNIIERHKGSMWAESEPAKGSIFYFTLPL
ncbi:hypothetical protein BH11BAC4_BH11BAC4_08770 [soil metagenome]